MADILELVEQFPNSSKSAAPIKTKFENDFVTPTLESAQNPALTASCLWCGRAFMRRATGGSAQKFCCTEHRQQFWIAARRWTMRAIEAGLLSVDCLKASQTSVHAA